MANKNEEQISKVIEDFKKLPKEKKMYVLGFMQATIVNSEVQKPQTA